jgi:hypothetical protein
LFYHNCKFRVIQSIFFNPQQFKQRIFIQVEELDTLFSMLLLSLYTLQLLVSTVELDFIDFINDELVALDKLEIPRKRNSMDTVKNCYGNKLLELCRGNSLFLLNGRVGEDQHEGRLTCKISSTVDYCLYMITFNPCSTTN